MTVVPNIGSRVRGDVGVFYVDRATEGEVIAVKIVNDEILVGVQLDDGDIAWVPASCVSVI